MRLLDVHCHYEDSRFDADRTAVLEAVAEKGIIAIDAGCSVRDSRRVCGYAEAYSNLYFCAGIHPENAAEFSQSALEELQALWGHEKCVGAGEIGLDYYWKENPPKTVQQAAFVAQAEAAKAAGKPVVIHCREAAGDMAQLVRAHDISFGIMHCFSESREMAKIYLDRGLYFSFGGTSTFKNAVRAVENLRYLPRDRVLLETDSPYLTPEPKRGERNDSGNLMYIAENLGRIWDVSAEEAAEITFENACRLFGRAF